MIDPRTKLSPFTLSLIGSSPRSLPHVPTLRELREINGSIPIPISVDQPPSPESGSQRVMRRDGGRSSELPPPYRGPTRTRTAWIEGERTGSMIQGGIPGEGGSGNCPPVGMRGSMPYGDEKVPQPEIVELESTPDQKSWQSWFTWLTCRGTTT